MLQQTQVATVIPYYMRFLEAFPDVRALAAATEDRVLERWSGLGYYRRAHHLHAAAKRDRREARRSNFRATSTALATLPGIGRSTAAAIAAFAFGARAAILDGNVKRVLARHRGIEGYPGAPKVETRVVGRSPTSLLPARDIARVHAGTDGSRRDGVHASGAALRPYARSRAIASRAATIACGSCRRHDRRRRCRSAAVRVLVIERGGEILFEKRPAARHLGRAVEPARMRARRRCRRPLSHSRFGGTSRRETRCRRSSTASRISR